MENNTQKYLLNIKDDIPSKTIAEFNEYDAFIKTQLDTVTKNNMYFLKCKEGMARNFMGRPKMSRKFKNSTKIPTVASYFIQ